MDSRQVIAYVEKFCRKIKLQPRFSYLGDVLPSIVLYAWDYGRNVGALPDKKLSLAIGSTKGLGAF